MLCVVSLPVCLDSIGCTSSQQLDLANGFQRDCRAGRRAVSYRFIYHVKPSRFRSTCGEAECLLLTQTVKSKKSEIDMPDLTRVQIGMRHMWNDEMPSSCAVIG